MTLVSDTGPKKSKYSYTKGKSDFDRQLLLEDLLGENWKNSVSKLLFSNTYSIIMTIFSFYSIGNV